MTTQTGARKMKLALIVAFLGYVAFTAIFATSFSQGPNNRNVTVDTRVNITQSFPELLAIDIEGGITNITLNAGAERLVTCNASIRDFNGGSTVAANATFYATPIYNPGSPDTNTTHYTNGSCAVTSTDGFFRNFTCSFPVKYHANLSFWNCTVNATDDYDLSVIGTNETHVDALLALNVTTLIDYGDMAVGDTSSEQTANVTNLGNLDINITLEGYGDTIDDGLSFVCDQGDIPVIYEKFGMIGGTDPSDYTNLSSDLQMISDLTILQQTEDNESVTNTTYWLLVVPPNPFGLCNGSVIFQAEYSHAT